MSVPNVGTSDASSVWQKRQQDFNSLVSSVESGSIQDAQNSLTALQQDSTPSASSNGPDQYTSSISQLFNAVQTGDITAAQQAVSALQGGSATYGPQQAPASGTTSSAQGSTFQTDFQALIAAVKSGDTTAAQTALSKVQSDMQTQGRGGHHHHHHGGGSSVSSSTSTTSTDDSINPLSALGVTDTSATAS